ncbi:MAG: sigma-70 family RNA polymerase sigma factor [Bacteroidetes bacterium]|nr:sigma-70 family RNA polymerase sigma factor [Bacteroidota bacterium]
MILLTNEQFAQDNFALFHNCWFYNPLVNSRGFFVLSKTILFHQVSTFFVISSSYPMKSMQSDNEKIISGCIRNEYKSQKILYKKYYNVLMGLCLRYCQSKDEAEDVLLTGFYRIFRNIKKYDGTGSFENWIKRIVVNAAIDNFRKNSKYYYHDNIDDFIDKEILSETMHDNFSSNDILEKVNELSEGSRVVFNLFTIEGYSHKEIAEILNVSESTSKTQLRRAKISLKKKLLEIGILKTNEKR